MSKPIDQITNAAGMDLGGLRRKTMLLGTITTQTITFFASKAAAEKLAEANGGEADGFIVAAAKGREGKFVVQVVDTDDGFLLGHL